MKIAKTLGVACLVMAAKGAVSSLAPVYDASDPEPDWNKKRKLPGIEVVFMGGTVKGKLLNHQALGSSLGVGQMVVVQAATKVYEGAHKPTGWVVIEIDGKPVQSEIG